TVMQTLNLDGFVVVTTPQELAVVDAKRSINMIKTLKLAVLGIVENMAGDMFGSGGGEQLAAEMGLDFLGRTQMRKDYRDTSKPASLHSKDVSKEYEHIAARVKKALAATADAAV
ncbi:MAG: Mrp/NBP35 family ATP-binding protein, partial [SAR202 cluster bacterium]|nr:Mrp/NBP35 family ATP-binding protein [SAR202 cluster bacterium]